MSFDNDPAQMGALDPAAMDQYQTNSYMTEAFDVPFGQAEQPAPQEAVAMEPSPQELNFKALREEVDRIKAEREAERREYSMQMDMLRANQRAPEPPPQAREMFAGKDADYLPNVQEIRQEWNAKEAAYQTRMQELEVQSRYSDYADVMQNYVGPLVKEKPHLVGAIQMAPNQALAAYEIGKLAQQARAQQQPSPPTPSPVAQRIVENSRKPGTLSGAGGQSRLSQADYFASMTDNEFMQMASKHLDSI